MNNIGPNDNNRRLTRSQISVAPNDNNKRNVGDADSETSVEKRRKPNEAAISSPILQEVYDLLRNLTSQLHEIRTDQQSLANRMKKIEDSQVQPLPIPMVVTTNNNSPPRPPQATISGAAPSAVVAQMVKPPATVVTAPIIAGLSKSMAQNANIPLTTTNGPQILRPPVVVGPGISKPAPLTIAANSATPPRIAVVPTALKSAATPVTAAASNDVFRYLNLVTLGKTAFEEKKWADATKFFQEALKLAVTDDQKYVSNANLGKTAFEEKKWADATKFYQEALKLAVTDSHKYTCNASLGVIAIEEKKWADAEKFTQEALKLLANNQEKYNCNSALAIASFQQEKHAESFLLNLETLKYADHPHQKRDRHCYIARLAFKLGRWDELERYLTLALVHAREGSDKESVQQFIYKGISQGCLQHLTPIL